MARKPLSQEALLAISLRCAEVIHAHDGDAPTRALVAASGLSERTFFRYFPTKDESIRPFLDAGNRAFARTLAQHVSHPAPTLLDAIVTALQEAFSAVRTDWSHHLMQLALTVPALRRVWLEATEDLAGMLLPTIATVLDLPQESAEARIAADEAVLIAISSVRRMVHLEEGPQEAIGRVGDAFRRDPLARTLQQSDTSHRRATKTGLARPSSSASTSAKGH